MIAGLILAVVFAAIQWLIFRSVLLVGLAMVLLAAAAFAASHFSLGKLEREIRTNLQVLGLGPQRMFKELD
jgi:hypothetical protein